MSELKRLNKRGLFSSESVSPGHPDSATDYIVNKFLTETFKADKNSRFACDGVTKNEFVTLGGEVTTTADINLEQLVKDAYKDIGYEIYPRVCNQVFTQSPDIAQGTNNDRNGWGDQGIMFGYANRETEEYFPLAISLSHEIIRRLYWAFKDGSFPNAKADMKSQVTIDYDKEVPEVHTVVVACQHTEDYSKEALENYIKSVCMEIFRDFNVPVSDNLIWHINGTGKFVIGGPIGDSGEVGRKLVVDSYGGYAPIGGGTQNGKDPTKSDKTLMYATRWLAKNIVAAGLADECTVQLATCIGVPEPVSIVIDAHGTEKVSVASIENYIKQHIELNPKAIIERFDMLNLDYATLGLIGHVGQSTKRGYNDVTVEVPWERLDLVEALKDALLSEDK